MSEKQSLDLSNDPAVLEAATGLSTPAETSPEQESDGSPSAWKWESDPHNPYNWPKWRKNVQLAMIALVGFTWYGASPAAGEG